jgi:hypothetical protein
MTTVALKDEITRRTLASVLWRVAAEDVGERFEDEIFSCTYIPMDWDAAADIDAKIAALKLTLADIELAREALPGHPATRWGAPACPTVDVELSVPADRLAKAVDGYRDSIRETDDFWGNEPEDRARLIATYDAATALLEQLSTPAEAVA